MKTDHLKPLRKLLAQANLDRKHCLETRDSIRKNSDTAKTELNGRLNQAKTLSEKEKVLEMRELCP